MSCIHFLINFGELCEADVLQRYIQIFMKTFGEKDVNFSNQRLISKVSMIDLYACQNHLVYITKQRIKYE